MVKFVARARPTLSVPSSVAYELDKETYIRLQGIINELANELHKDLGCSYKLVRIEFEQLVWGWDGSDEGRVFARVKASLPNFLSRIHSCDLAKRRREAPITTSIRARDEAKRQSRSLLRSPVASHVQRPAYEIMALWSRTH